VVKKCGLLKIIHVKYKDPTTKAKPSPELMEFREIMQEVATVHKDIAPFVGKAQEILNPLRVLYLFRSTTPEVDLCLYIYLSTCTCQL